MSSCENDEGERRGREKEEGAGGRATSSMEFLKAGSNWRLSVCLCSSGGSRENCVLVRDCVNVHAGICM